MRGLAGGLAALAKLYVAWRRVENPMAYARTAVVRAAIDETRRPWWRREQSHGDALPDVAVVDGTHAVDDRLQLRAALGRLPVWQWAVLVLRFLEGLSVHEAGFRVDDPSDADLASDTALVHRLGATSGSQPAATLRVFHPGTDPVDQPRRSAISINGRTGFFDDDGQGRLWWQYGDGLYAVLTAQGAAMTHLEMRGVAQAFRIGARRPVVIGFRTERPPAGYVLVAAHRSVDGRSSGASFQLASVVRQATDPRATAPAGNPVDPSDPGFRIDLNRWTPSDPASPSCPPVAGSAVLACYRRVGDSVISATWAASTTEPLTAALNSTLLGTVDVNGAFPASARLPG